MTLLYLQRENNICQINNTTVSLNLSYFIYLLCIVLFFIALLVIPLYSLNLNN